MMFLEGKAAPQRTQALAVFERVFDKLLKDHFFLVSHAYWGEGGGEGNRGEWVKV